MSKEEIFNKIKDLISEYFDVYKEKINEVYRNGTHRVKMKTRSLKVLALPTIWMLIQLT